MCSLYSRIYLFFDINSFVFSVRPSHSQPPKVSDPYARGGPLFIPPSLKTSKRGRPYTNEPTVAIQQQSASDSSTESISSSRNQLTLQQIQNRNRNSQFAAPESKKANEFQGTSQENSKFNRNRFHPLSSTKPPSTGAAGRATTTTPTPSTASPPPPSTPSSTNTRDLDPTRSRLAALTNRFNVVRSQSQNNSNSRSNKLQRQPLYSSRESNTPIDVVNPTVKKINVTHNGSANRDASSSEAAVVETTTTSTRIVNNPLLKLQQLQQQRNQVKQVTAPKINETDKNTSTNLVQSKESDKTLKKAESENDDKVYDDELEEYDDEDYENGNDASPVAGYEEERTNVSSDRTPKSETKSENEPVILTSNFYLPGKTTTPLPSSLEAIDESSPQTEEKIENVSQAIDEPKQNDSKSSPDKIDVPLNDDKEPLNEEKEKFHKIVETSSTSPADVEYEYEYEYEDETTTPQIVAPTTKSSATSAAAKQENATDETSATDSDYYETTTVASINANISDPIQNGDTDAESIPTASPDPNEIDSNSTESYVVVASVQTSRSISGARFLPFPQVEQEEKKQSLADLEKSEDDEDEELESIEQINGDQADDLNIHGDYIENTTATLTTAHPEETTNSSNENGTTQETSTDKASTSTKVHRLSSVSEKLAHLHEKIDNVELTTKGVPVVIRKFMPRTTKYPQKSDTVKSTKSENAPQQNDEQSAQLPPGFKFRPNSSYKNGKIVSTTTSEPISVPQETESIIPEIKKKIQFKEIAIEDLLPKDYKPLTEIDTPDEDDLLAKLLPKDFKQQIQATTKAPLRLSTVTEDVSKFLPPGFSKSKENTSKRPFSDVTILDDISKLLPPGFKLPKTTKSTTAAPKPATILDDISKFLPPGFELPTPTSKPATPNLSFNDDLSQFLPPDFKLNASENEDSSSIENTPKFNTTDISSLLPPGFSLNQTETADTPTTSAAPSFKVVFPKGLPKRPGFGRVTTPKPSHIEGPPPPNITIRKGLPTR